VGINGEIYLRSNAFSNGDLVRKCEDAGLEAYVSPITEWIKYSSYRNLEDAVKSARLREAFKSYVKKLVQEADERHIERGYAALIDGREPATAALLGRSARYLSPRCGSEAVLSIGSGIDWLESPHFAGVISVMPLGCMPGGIVAAMSEGFSRAYEKPWISLQFDGFSESNNAARIAEFAELLKLRGAEGPLAVAS
jgi:predicted nucleotide-binding protein (sugar kinase/HSP70/actin superfamily)